MIINSKDYRFYLECDRLALGRTSKKPKPFCDPIWHFERLLRRYELAVNRRNFWDRLTRVFLNIRYNRLQMKLGFSIPLNVFGAGLAIVHRGNIIVSGNSHIGENCRIHVGVTIGASGGETDAATIGNNVYIGPGAKIVGAINIADGVVIGANAVVVHDIEQTGITVGGVPARKISDNNSEKHLVNATAFMRNRK